MKTLLTSGCTNQLGAGHNVETNFAEVSCASCGYEVTKSELLELLQTGEFKQPKKLITSML
jgi:hypothetical protein